MADLEIKIDSQVGLLNWNFDDLNAQLDVILKRYDGLQYTEDQITEAKATRAKLNNVSKAINSRKIEIKKQFCAPYTEFETQAKKLISRIDECSNQIDAQVKEYEEKDKESKRKKITEWWSEHGRSNVSIDQIWNDKWLNKTYSDSAWQNDLNEFKDDYDRDMSIISRLVNGEDGKVEFMLADYQKTFNLNQCMIDWEDEQNRRHMAEVYRQEQEFIKENSKPTGVNIHDAMQADKKDDEILERCMRVWGTKKQIIAVGNFMNANNIKFKKVEVK